MIETYKQEVISQPVSAFEDKEVIGELVFDFEDGREDFSRRFEGNIYKEFTDLRKLLEEYGYPVPEKIQAEEVRKIYIRDYRSDREGEAEITEPEEIRETLDKIYYEDCADTEPNIYVEIEFKDSSYSYKSYSLKK